MYYGYYLGDSQEWDTDYVKIPGDTPEEKYEEVAKEIFLETMNKMTDGHGEPLHIAFSGLYCVDDRMEDDEDCNTIIASAEDALTALGVVKENEDETPDSEE